MAHGHQRDDLRSTKEALAFEDLTHDIGTDEAHKAATFTDRELWGLNKKVLFEIEVRQKELALKRAEHDFAHKQKMDSLEFQSAQNIALFNHAVNMEYAKFNAASSEPISPNTDA